MLSVAASRPVFPRVTLEGLADLSDTIVTVGVDTHSHVHVAAALDQAGRLLAIASFPATTRGYA